MTTAESMALAVLKGDLCAARALADSLFEDVKDGGREVLPTRKFPVDMSRLKFIFFVEDPETQIDLDALQASVKGWAEGEGPLVLFGKIRLEVYELPAGEAK